MTHQCPHPHRRTDFPSPATINCQQLLSYEWDLGRPSPILTRTLAALVLLRSYVGNHSCYEFMRPTATPYPEGRVLFSWLAEGLIQTVQRGLSTHRPCSQPIDQLFSLLGIFNKQEWRDFYGLWRLEVSSVLLTMLFYMAIAGIFYGKNLRV